MYVCMACLLKFPFKMNYYKIYMVTKAGITLAPRNTILVSSSKNGINIPGAMLISVTDDG